MPHRLKVVTRSAVYCPLITVFHARSESFRRPYTGKLFVLPPQLLLGYSEVPTSIHLCWDWLVKKEMLSDRSLNITIRDVHWIIRHCRNGILFPREILALDDSCKLARRVGIAASLRSDVVAFRYLADFAPPLMQVYLFPPDILGLLVPFCPTSNFC